MTKPIRLAVIGVGKIARDQHVPAIAASPDFLLRASASHSGEIAGFPNFSSIDDLLANGPAIDAVSVCTPPDDRCRIARLAIAAGKHVMMEKPPAATIGEVIALTEAARNVGVALHAAWHSREAAAVETARQWLRTRDIRSVSILWQEDIRKWHPGQDWILAPGGFGVFDPGINALSIATAILPGRLMVRAARFEVPANRHEPIAAQLEMSLDDQAPVAATFDFRASGGETWDIAVDTDAGLLTVTDGGAHLTLDGAAMSLPPHDGEYSRLYKRFAELVRDRAIDADHTPLTLVADAALIATRHGVAPFEF